jgi:hypothetical protein
MMNIGKQRIGLKSIISKTTLAALMALSFVNAANNVTDKVQSLPDCSPLPTNWYSGYLNVT